VLCGSLRGRGQPSCVNHQLLVRVLQHRHDPAFRHAHRVDLERSREDGLRVGVSRWSSRSLTASCSPSRSSGRRRFGWHFRPSPRLQLGGTGVRGGDQTKPKRNRRQVGLQQRLEHVKCVEVVFANRQLGEKSSPT
jgi:hypothetical protein